MEGIEGKCHMQMDINVLATQEKVLWFYGRILNPNSLTSTQMTCGRNPIELTTKQ